MTQEKKKSGRKQVLPNPVYRSYYFPESTVTRIEALAAKASAKENRKVSYSEVLSRAVEAFKG